MDGTVVPPQLEVVLLERASLDPPVFRDKHENQ